MAKAKEPATETLVETVQNNDFAQPEPEQLPARGTSVQEDIEAIRAQRAKERAARGPALKRRRVTNYHDAERLKRLVERGHVHLATPEEIVDWEEAGLLPDPAHYYNSSPPEFIVPPDEGV